MTQVTETVVSAGLPRADAGFPPASLLRNPVCEQTPSHRPGPPHVPLTPRPPRLRGSGWEPIPGPRPVPGARALGRTRLHRQLLPGASLMSCELWCSLASGSWKRGFNGASEESGLSRGRPVTLSPHPRPVLALPAAPLLHGGALSGRGPEVRERGSRDRHRHGLVVRGREAHREEVSVSAPPAGPSACGASLCGQPGPLLSWGEARGFSTWPSLIHGRPARDGGMEDRCPCWRCSRHGHLSPA